VLLEDEPDQLATVAWRPRLAPDLAPVDQDAAAGRLVETADQVEQRALARPGSPGDREHLARIWRAAMRR
jgi:hypothetical protein